MSAGQITQQTSWAAAHGCITSPGVEAGSQQPGPTVLSCHCAHLACERGAQEASHEATCSAEVCPAPGSFRPGRIPEPRLGLQTPGLPVWQACMQHSCLTNAGATYAPHRPKVRRGTLLRTQSVNAWALSCVSQAVHAFECIRKSDRLSLPAQCAPPEDVGCRYVGRQDASQPGPGLREALGQRTGVRLQQSLHPALSCTT